MFTKNELVLLVFIMLCTITGSAVLVSKRPSAVPQLCIQQNALAMHSTSPVADVPAVIPTDKNTITEAINVNEAGTSVLLHLPGVGPKTAEAIVAYRDTKGKFQTPDDLMRVKGIGKKKLEKFRHLITF